jgi:hypothetical protein
MAGENPSDPTSLTRVAFIGGTGRSGSTLLSRVLGSIRGVCSVGELAWIWNYGLTHDRDCGCGVSFSRCPFWTEVGRIAYGGWQNVDAEKAIALRRQLMRNRQVPNLWRGGGTASAELAEYTSLLSRLYRAICTASGAEVVVDNSKQTAAALIARQTPGVDLRVIHLVRRSHGVAYSWTKHVARTDKGGKEMRRRPPVRTALRWTTDNVLFESLGRCGTPRLLVRYEDFVADARTQTEQMLGFLGLERPSEALPFLDRDTVDLATDHSVWGNPMRLRKGPERLRLDEAWQSGLSRRDRSIVTALSWPALARYGYLPQRDLGGRR